MDWVKNHSNEILIASSALGIGGICALILLPPATLALLSVQAAIHSTCFFFGTMLGGSLNLSNNDKVFTTNSPTLFSSLTSSTAVAIAILIGLSQPISLLIGAFTLLATLIIPAICQQAAKRKNEKLKDKEIKAGRQKLIDLLDEHMDRIDFLGTLMRESTEKLNTQTYLLNKHQSKPPNLFTLKKDSTSTSSKRIISEAWSKQTMEMHISLRELLRSYPTENTIGTLAEIENLYNQRVEHMQKIEDLSRIIFEDTDLRIRTSEIAAQKPVAISAQ